MLMRAACFVLVVTLGLSACTRPISDHPGENATPTAVIEDGQIADITSTLPLSVIPAESPTETSLATGVAQIHSESISSPEVLSSDASTEDMPPYRLQAGTPRFMANFIQPEAGCNWMGVGGQAFNLSGQPVTPLVVEVGGKLAGEDVFHLELTGNQTNLGTGGYVVTLANQPVASIGTLWILLYDLGGLPLTDKIYFSTSQDCASNFVLINFVEANPNYIPRLWLPILSK